MKFRMYENIAKKSFIWFLFLYALMMTFIVHKVFQVCLFLIKPKNLKGLSAQCLGSAAYKT